MQIMYVKFPHQDGSLVNDAASQLSGFMMYITDVWEEYNIKGAAMRKMDMMNAVGPKSISAYAPVDISKNFLAIPPYEKHFVESELIDMRGWSF